MKGHGWLVTVSILSLAACDRPAIPDADRSAGSSLPGAAETGRERIVYSSLRPGNWDVFLFEQPGAAPRRLTNHPGLDYDATFSPDGRWVVFTSERRGNPDLYVIDLEQGGAPRLLIDGVGMEAQAAFSPDGATFAFAGTRAGGTDIYAIAFDPTAIRCARARSTGGSSFISATPAASPNRSFGPMRACSRVPTTAARATSPSA